MSGKHSVVHARQHTNPTSEPNILPLNTNTSSTSNNNSRNSANSSPRNHRHHNHQPPKHHQQHPSNIGDHTIGREELAGCCLPLLASTATPKPIRSVYLNLRTRKDRKLLLCVCVILFLFLLLPVVVYLPRYIESLRYSTWAAFGPSHPNNVYRPPDLNTPEYAYLKQHKNDTLRALAPLPLYYTREKLEAVNSRIGSPLPTVKDFAYDDAWIVKAQMQRQVQFLLFSGQRCGSRWVLESLNGHPLLPKCCYNEHFDYKSVLSYKRYSAQFQKIWTALYPGKPVNEQFSGYAFMHYFFSAKNERWFTKPLLGFKVMANQFLELNKNAWIGVQRYIDDYDLKIIFLDRRNLVDILLSETRAQKLGVAHCAKAGGDKKKGASFGKSTAKRPECNVTAIRAMKYEIEQKTVMKELYHLEYKFRMLDIAFELLPRERFLKISYEDLMTFPDASWCRILTFLGLVDHSSWFKRVVEGVATPSMEDPTYLRKLDRQVDLRNLHGTVYDIVKRGSERQRQIRIDLQDRLQDHLFDLRRTGTASTSLCDIPVAQLLQTSSEQKMILKKHFDTVGNYEEISYALSGTKFDTMLDKRPTLAVAPKGALAE